MIGKLATLSAVAGLAFFLAVGAFGYPANDFAKGVNSSADTSPNDAVSGINDYEHQPEQLNLEKDAGTVKVLRTDQKALLNDFVTEIVELKNVNVRELLGLARTICRKEGGDADVLQDFESKKYYLAIVCPKFQVEYVKKTLQALDQPWVTEINDGSWILYYKCKNRDVHNIMNILHFYRTPDWLCAADDSNNAGVIYDQPCIAGLIGKGASEVDIPPSILSMDVAMYEVDTQNDLALGYDWEAWKNGPGKDLFEAVCWGFGGKEGKALFPGSAPLDGEDWGHFRSYDVTLTTAYLDFLRTSGKARLVSEGTLTAKSGTVADLAATDQIAAFRVSGSSTPSTISPSSLFRLSKVYDFYHNEGEVDMSLTEVLAQQPKTPASAIVDQLIAFLTTVVGVDSATANTVRATLDEKAKDGLITEDDVEDTFVPLGVTLTVFRDRTLKYLESGRVGILLSMLPVVGQKSAEVALALDLSEVTGFTPSGEPIIEHRYISSDFEVGNGQPITLGGLTRVADVDTWNGIPFLSDIPYVGKYLFGHTVHTKRTKELVVMLTPRFNVFSMKDAGMMPREVNVSAVVKQAKGEEKICVPPTPFSFDQYLLDWFANRDKPAPSAQAPEPAQAAQAAPSPQAEAK